MAPNKSVILARHPIGFPVPGEDLVVTTSEIDLNAPLAPDSVLLKALYVSFDPFQRGCMEPPTVNSYIGKYNLNEPLANAGILRVLSSTHSRFKPGDLVSGFAEFSEYQIVGKEKADKTEEERGFSIFQNPLELDEKLYLGALGMSGLTAYSSLYEIGKPKKGETIFISAASGAVGQIVGQLAKREGLRVFGSVGSDEKLKFIIEELGFDGGFNYKMEAPDKALKRLVGEGETIDIYYDNVGGEILDTALLFMNFWGRVINCGFISQSSKIPSERYALKNVSLVIAKRISFRGFIVIDPDMGPKYTIEHQRNMAQWLKDGEIVTKMDVTYGIENAAEGLVGVFKGKNFGKAILKIADL